MIDAKMLKEGEDIVNNIMAEASVLKEGEVYTLEHTGKKGMKWGVRRGAKTPMKTSSEHKKVAEIRKKKTPQLTNKQIKTANERMNLEQNFRRMNPSTVRRGHMKVKAVIGTLIAAKALHELVTSKSGQAAMALGKQAIAKQTAKKAAKIALKNAPKQLSLF